MASSAVTKAARRAAREAPAAAQEGFVPRTRANVADLPPFLSARERAEAVDGWLAERLGALHEKAAQRRAAELRRCGAALRAMRDRGESVGEIARMAGITEKTVRDLIRDADEPSGAGVVAESGTEALEEPALPIAETVSAPVGAPAPAGPVTPAGDADAVGWRGRAETAAVGGCADDAHDRR